MQQPTTQEELLGIIDNYNRGKVGEFLRHNILSGSTLSIVSAYFTIYAFKQLKAELTAIDNLAFLFGEPSFLKSLDPTRTETKAFQIVDNGLNLQNRLQQKPIAKECAIWIEEKVQIRSVKRAGFLHGKLYHISHNGKETAILGSSNFTTAGLGFGSGSNIELNLVVDSERDRHELKVWFDSLWNDLNLVEDVKSQVLQYLEQLYQNHPPQFIYYKTLFHVFEKFLADQDNEDLSAKQNQLVDTQIWKHLFEFQKDGVKGAINKILNHNGCIIADSVGLGKTFEALAVIKYFELMNGKVLVLCPKKLRDNWTNYLNNSDRNPFVKDRFNFHVLSHTDLSRESGKTGDIDLATINWGNYDLVVIDESHNFRNNNKGRRDEEGNIISKSRYARLMEDVLKSGIPTKVLLLSATPVNNDLKDLRNQFYLLTEDRDDAFHHSLGIASLKDTLANAQRSFTQWAKERDSQGNRQVSDLLELLNAAFFKLLDELTIARSRKHIQLYYADTIKQLGGFPERHKPIAIYAEIDLKDYFISYDRLNDEISHYQLSLFNPNKYVLPQFRSHYDKRLVGNFSQSDREHYLIGMMKVNFLKRLESSVKSFSITLERTIAKLEGLITRIEQFKKFHITHTDFDYSDEAMDTVEDEEVLEALQVGAKLTYKMAHLDVEAWLKDLKQDISQLTTPLLHANAIGIERDAKLAELKKLIENKVKNPTINKLEQPNRKVLVFTAFADTAIYLYESLLRWATDLNIHIALVTGSSSPNKTTFGKSDYNQILTNFSPRSKQRDMMRSMPQDSEIDLLLATDCISEGQNLQDCDYLVNYDIHWNPVRIIQRFGRIDRIGSVNTHVQMVNFWATPDLNKYLNLKNRIEARMALVDITATAEDNLLRNEVEEFVKADLKYRDKQLLQLKEEVLDLEDFNEGVALNEFTLDDFRMELARFIESNRKLLEAAPLGLYAVVPSSAEVEPGVIFCLRQKEGSSGDEINPLQPYFLVYVREDKVVRFGFAQPKQILKIYQQLCSSATKPYQTLCDLFDQEINHGNDMAIYNDLLKLAINSISRTFKQRSLNQLQMGRGGMLPDKSKQVEETTDFDLITWLVIKNDPNSRTN